ncbi:alpha/beta fold hydrolase [Tropicibacter oceani]|uniref:Alpha/beta hydrolase n=1 Tax=Tropicibacter oceani TaxID=3058420 RepID=A0ABY8QHR5_9RHOB|nr:alpha/beta hydrolase [Tropicibacter oceani]WGW04196.1 alpha/beta hydrolase [Tropicibacter oceani]
MSNASVIATLAGLGALSVPMLREGLRKPMNARAREAAPGQFAQLSQGITHYQWLGAAEGPVAVCVHGLTTPSFVWRTLAEDLGAMGFRVLVYDLFGRGFSDRPRGPQGAAFFTQQLDDLLRHEGVRQDITLIGYSMGGAIATSFAAEHGHRLRRLILLAPAGMGHDLGRLAAWAVDWPVIGDWAFHLGFPRSLLDGIRADAARHPEAAVLQPLLEAELTYRGYSRSVLASLRGILRATQPDEHRHIARQALPVTAIWGRDDTVIPIRAMAQLTQWNRDARNEVIKGAGHGLPYTHKDHVIQAIRDTWVGPVV